MAKPFRSIVMSYVPRVVLGLDDDTVVVGLSQESPLQVWDLATGTVVRELEGTGKDCRSLVCLSGGRIAAGWVNGDQSLITIFDVNSGKQLQKLVGIGNNMGLALVDDHLISVGGDRSICVWIEDAAGVVR